MSVNYIIDRILPEGCIHLVAGPTGAGKTRWIVEMMQEWSAGRPVLGFASHPQPWLYVSADRSEHEAIATIESMGIAIGTVPLLPAFAPIISESKVFQAAEERGARVLVWEGFGNYVSSNSNGFGVKQWISSMTRMLRYGKGGRERPEPMTILGVMEQPKMKPRDRYDNPRQRISGPAAWGHSCSTIILVEHGDKNHRGPRRVLGVYPRNAADMEFRATLATGHFVIVP